MILLAEAANRTKKGGQELIGGLDVRVNRNHFGRQVESFQARLDLPFLAQAKDNGSGRNNPFPGVFIRAPVVEKILPHVEGVQTAQQPVDETVVAPSRQVQDDRARKAIASGVTIMGILPGRLSKCELGCTSVAAGNDEGDIIAVRQGNVFGTSFHPELTDDIRIHVWWLMEVVQERVPILQSS